MKRQILKSQVWSSNFMVLMITVFMVNFGTGLTRGASTNFFIETLDLSGTHVLWLAGLREIPGLGLMFIAAMIASIALPRRAAMALVIMGVGYALYAGVNTFTSLVLVAIVASLGFHVWMPLSNSLTMALVPKEHAGRAMGTKAAVTAVAGIVGTLAVVLVSGLAPDMSLRVYYIACGLAIVVAGALLFKIPADVGSTRAAQARMLLRKRYWLYYVLTFFEGSRMQVFGTFGTLILVQDYGLSVSQISGILVASSVVNFFGGPILGRFLDERGERLCLSASYVALALCFVGYATVHNAWVLACFLIGINLLTTLSMGLQTYVRRIAPEEELTPTLSAGVSINHITSVGMSLVAGSLLALVGYEALCWGAAAIIMLSVPFAMAIKTRSMMQVAPSAAE